ncbi:Methyltransferase domain protein [Roseovarius albus]|uniref:Methyltransferase domain protein n=1 Tax=Roseovarius albus TaxID=1247867 RepID=A0A1X7A6V6_9RHOB|nr:DUF938 domain-containing protein [Roseovarius albus]SLN72178.1 Methyltransferase domain protein [Roseovarius albus]
MPIRPPLSGVASVASPEGGGKLSAPAAARNKDSIVDALRRFLPASGNVLELASGTGQHAVALAKAFPNLIWQPTDMDPSRLSSIDAWADEAELENLKSAVTLDAVNPGWATAHAPQDGVLLVNLLHLISTNESKCIIREAAQALNPGGRLMIYGPFLREGRATSEGDQSFHSRLQSHDPETGYKDHEDVMTWGLDQGLAPHDTIEMPANNLFLIWQKPAV